MDKEQDLPVLFFRLLTSEDIIAEINEEKENHYSLKYPMRVVTDADLEAGRQTIYMHSWLPQGIINVSSCILNKKDVIVSGVLEADVEEYYRATAFDLFVDIAAPKLKSNSSKVEYNDPDRKIISFTSKNTNKE